MIFKIATWIIATNQSSPALSITSVQFGQMKCACPCVLFLVFVFFALLFPVISMNHLARFQVLLNLHYLGPGYKRGVLPRVDRQSNQFGVYRFTKR